MRTPPFSSSPFRALVSTALACNALPVGAGAQEAAREFTACYVPEVGVVYLIEEPGLPSSCLSEAHQEFSWTEGPGGAPELVEGSVTTDVLADAAVTQAKLAPGAVAAAHIQAETIGSDHVLDDALTQDDLGPGSVTGSELAPSAVTGSHVQDGTLTGDDIEDGAILGDDIADGAVTSDEIMNGAVTGDDVADGTLTGGHIEDGSLARTDLSPDVITASGLAYVNGTSPTPQLVRNRNAVSVVRRSGLPAGGYEITFAEPVNLATAYVTATPLGSGLTVGLVLASNSVLWVFVRNSANEYTDAPFFVIVF